MAGIFNMIDYPFNKAIERIDTKKYIGAKFIQAIAACNSVAMEILIPRATTAARSSFFALHYHAMR